MAPRRFSTYLLLTGFLMILLFLYTTSNSTVSSLAKYPLPKPSSLTAKLPSFPKPAFPFRKASHKPPEQPDSVKGIVSWYSDWKWLNPFSSSITLEENRSVLPPLPPRPPVYAYYEHKGEKDSARIQTDLQVLLTWRRAWWAHGFRPVILGTADAQSNPLYVKKAALGLKGHVNEELDKWLAWDYMGTGLLTTWSCVPMGSYDDPLLSHLRRGRYPALTQYQTLGTGLFAGEASQIRDAIGKTLSNRRISSAKTLWEVLEGISPEAEPTKAIAHYDSETVASKYPTLAPKIIDSPDEGRQKLDVLINSHLHSTWQNIFRNGIAVLKPLPAHSTGLVATALELAEMLAECPESILPSSCPPNLPDCHPCVASRMQIKLRGDFKNDSSLYSIGTVPHPYTTLSLSNMSDEFTVSDVRRRTKRDLWLKSITQYILGSGRGGPSRVVGFKDAMIAGQSHGRGLWFTTEQLPESILPTDGGILPEAWITDLDWHFGFSIPRRSISRGETEDPQLGPNRKPKIRPGVPEDKKKSWDPDPPSDEQLAAEVELLKRTRGAVDLHDPPKEQIVKVTEAWNLADTEAWRFTRAFRERAILERARWTEEEDGHGPTGNRKGRWWDI